MGAAIWIDGRLCCYKSIFLNGSWAAHASMRKPFFSVNRVDAFSRQRLNSTGGAFSPGYDAFTNTNAQ